MVRHDKSVGQIAAIDRTNGLWDGIDDEPK